jgi:hypothetical protein
MPGLGCTPDLGRAFTFPKKSQAKRERKGVRYGKSEVLICTENQLTER